MVTPVSTSGEGTISSNTKNAMTAEIAFLIFPLTFNDSGLHTVATKRVLIVIKMPIIPEITNSVAKYPA